MFDSLLSLFNRWRSIRGRLSGASKVPQHSGIRRAGELEKFSSHEDTIPQELRRRWEYLAEAQKLSHSGIFAWNVSSGMLEWSDETYRILGFTRETHPTLDLVFDRIHPEDRERLLELRDRAARDGMDLDVEHRLLMDNGDIRYIHVVAHAGHRNSGDREYIGIVSDITERKRAEEERQALSDSLQESKAWLEEAQHVAHLGYWVWDLETNQVILSEETYRIFGLVPQAGSIDVSKVGEMMHPDDREAVFRTAEEAIRSGTRADCEHRLFRPDGEMRIVHSLGDLKKDSSGRPCQMFGTNQDITERKRVEEERETLSNALQQSNARLEDAQRVAHIGHYEWKLLENRVTWSDELYRIYGLPPRKDPIDMATVFEMVHPEDRENVAREADEAIRSGTPLNMEHRIVRPDGEVRYVQTLGTAKRDASGRIYEMFGTGQDITERKHAEQALQRSQFYLSEGERLAHMGSWATSDLGIHWSDDLDIYWSDEVYKIFGFDPTKGAPNLQQFFAAIHPQDRASLVGAMTKMDEQHCSCDTISRIVRPDGEIRFVRCVGIPVLEDGVFRGYHGTTIDVTAQELLTQELRREQAYLAEAQSLTHAGSWACNLLTREIFHSSDENTRLYGFDPSQGPIPFDLFYGTILPEDERKIRATLEHAVNAGEDYDVEFRIRRSDGDIRYLRGIGHHNPSQEVGEYFGITMDITERKRAEEERERLRLLEADLAHINRVNMMGELAAALAHEIKQPIAASITSASACLRWLGHVPPDVERARAAAARIEQEGNRAADIISSLQSFYRTGTPAELQYIDAKEIIGEMTALLRTEAARYSVTIRPEFEADPPQILEERVQLQQVLMNLMLNAIEAMKDTGGELTIRSQVSAEGLTVSISDTGIGLPAEGPDLIFDPFHTTKPQGTGMGLTITRSIVEAYGGRVWATANEGAGATFHFTLPTRAEAHA